MTIFFSYLWYSSYFPQPAYVFTNLISIIKGFFTTYIACSLSGIHYGTGRHLKDISPEDIPKALYFWWLCELLYAITTASIRLSIALFLLRICINPSQRWVMVP
jgi:hypothetical protein